MKKIIAFLFCTSVISSAFAQTDSRNWNSRNANVNDYSNLNDYHNYGYQNIINQGNQEIQKTNYQNNWQVQQIVSNFDLNIWDKRDILINLETQRIQKINEIYSKYSNSIAYYHSRGSERNDPFYHRRFSDYNGR